MRPRHEQRIREFLCYVMGEQTFEIRIPVGSFSPVVMCTVMTRHPLDIMVLQEMNQISSEHVSAMLYVTWQWAPLYPPEHPNCRCKP